MKTKSVSLTNMKLLLAYEHNPSLELRNQIVELNTGLVRKVARRVSQKCAEPYEDLEQLGYLGLIKAIERFKPHQGYAFSSFAIPFIRGEMLHYLRDKASLMKIPRRSQELYSKGQKLRRKLTFTPRTLSQDSEIARSLGISLLKWRECCFTYQNRLPVSLDATVDPLNNTKITLGEILPDPRTENKQRQQEERLQLDFALNQLEDKTKAAIEGVFLWDLSRQEIAEQIGISPMTVTRYLKKGIKQLTLILQAQAV
jgi:RNA polymerase sigma-B factor